MNDIKFFGDLVSRLYNHPVCDIIVKSKLLSPTTKTKKSVAFSDRLLLVYLIINKLWDLGINKINELHNALLDIDWDFFKELVKPHLFLQDMLWSGQFDKRKLIWFTPTQHIWVRKNKKFILQCWKAKEPEFIEEDIQHVPWLRERYFDDDTYDSKQSERSLGGKLDILQTKNKALFHYFVYLYLYTYYHNISVIERISCTNQNNELKTDQKQYFSSRLMSKCIVYFMANKKKIHHSVTELWKKKHIKPKILESTSIKSNDFMESLWFNEMDFFYPWSEYFIGLWDCFVEEELLSQKVRNERKARREEIKSQLWLDKLDSEVIAKLVGLAKRILRRFCQ